jgi:hypothetical protein
MALASNPQRDNVSAFVRFPAHDKPLTVSRCLNCGLIVAAASDRRLLQVAEELHHCPVYLNYMPTAARADIEVARPECPINRRTPRASKRPRTAL